MNSNEQVIFVARASTAPNVEEKIQWLLERLEFVQDEYRLGEACGEYAEDPQRFAFVHPSNRALPREGATIGFLRGILKNLKTHPPEILLVVSWWYGLTTNPFDFDYIFSALCPGVRASVVLRIYAEDPRRFFEVNAGKVCELLRG
ncbi:uncharacterized protein N7483_013095 [Penicillium malachiteum]|uniref:uncharacterized protein n=1 Tax=Penicillium malachiteum TaxID=1324776 RepID=UPI00254867C4|nr:uncharacterized protein N7483_013095 [Penicillium malachiteum]KAJ5715914.1 hypothetical protein N7483_013095 [Penicillium malachiteum]